MQNAQLTLLVPDVNIDSPSLKTLINRSDTKELTAKSWEAMLCQLFGINPNDELPIAAITGLADGLPTHSHYWLRADPTQLQADLSAVYLIGNTALNLTPQEVNFLQQGLNQFFKQDQLQLFTPTADRWYLQSNAPPQINTFPLQQVIGKNILKFLPQGANQDYWRKLFTEVQMLLHASTSKVNGLWFWGVGQLPDITDATWQAVWSEDILLKGLAQTAKIPSTPLPKQVQNILQQLTDSQHHLVSLSNETPNAEENWFRPLINALRKKQLNQLTLYLGTDKSFQINTKTIKYFWRRKI